MTNLMQLSLDGCREFHRQHSYILVDPVAEEQGEGGYRHFTNLAVAVQAAYGMWVPNTKAGKDRLHRQFIQCVEWKDQTMSWEQIRTAGAEILHQNSIFEIRRKKGEPLGEHSCLEERISPDGGKLEFRITSEIGQELSPARY